MVTRRSLTADTHTPAPAPHSAPAPPPPLWGEAGALEGIHAGGRWGPTARRRRRFFGIFFLFCAIFYFFSKEFAGLRPCYHALRQPVGAADRALLHN